VVLLCASLQVMEWFGNIKKQPLEVGKAGDGTLITSMPEDMFNVIHMQVGPSSVLPVLLC
jgi:hypothetical protein